MSGLIVTYHDIIAHIANLGIEFIPWDCCQRDSKLGSGASMNVFSGTYKVKGTIQEVALKFVKTRLTGTTTETKRNAVLRDIKQEIRIMGRLKGHSRIIQLLGVSFDDHTPILILELAMSDLEVYLQSKRVEWKVKLEFMYDIALGLEAIHKAEVVHGDLKGTNILICNDENNQIVAKISDFGFSSTYISVLAGRIPGYSPHFRSRECFDRELSDWNGKHTTDMYSYGLVVCQIADNGTIPFEDYAISEIDTMKKEGTEAAILIKNLPDDTPMEVRKIINATVRNIPSERSNLNEIKITLKESTEWNQIYSYEEAKSAFESLAQVGPQESLKISKMNELPIPPSLKISIFREYKRLADAGDAIAQDKLGSCWLYGFGIEQDSFKAVECYAKAAEDSNASAQCNLGVCYYVGEGVARDYIKAAELYKMAAKTGYADAQCYLGYCYQHSNGVPKDYIKAVELYSMAAETGNTNAQCNLGVCYYNGQGVDKDYIKAVELYTKAAKAGNADAQFSLGVCYNEGHGVAKNYAKAIEMYTLAAEAGNANAQCNLGICYYNGEGVTMDYDKAVEMYMKAAETGNAKAMSNLGYCYQYGKGVPMDYYKAVDMYRNATEATNASVN